MYIVGFLIAIIIISLLIALPFIFKSIFKTRNYLGYSMGTLYSALSAFTSFLILLFGVTLCYKLIRGNNDHFKDSFYFSFAVLIFAPIFIILFYNISIYI